MSVFSLVAEITLNASSFKQGLSDALNELKKIGPETGNTFQQVGTGLEVLGSALAPLSKAAGAVFVPAVKSAVAYEDQLAKVFTLVDSSQGSMKELSNMFLELSNATGRSTAELAEAGYQALSASVQYEDLSEFLMTATNLSKVGFTDTATAVDILTTTMNAYGESAGSAEEIANKLVLTQNKGKTTVDELATTMGRVIPIAASANVSIDELSTAYAVLTKQGISTRMATTDINALIQALSDSSGDLAGIIQEKLNMSFKDFMAQGGHLNEVLYALQEYAKENNLEFTELFNTTTAQTAAFDLTNISAEEYAETLDEMANNQSVLDEGLQKLNTNGAKIRKMLTQWKNLLIQVGSAFLDMVAPAIETVGNFATTMSTAFMSVSDPVKKVIAGVLAFTTALSPALTVSGKLAYGFGEIAKWAGISSGALSAIIAVVAVVIAALVNLWNTNEGFRKTVMDAWANIQDIVAKVAEAVKQYIDEIKEWIQSMMPVIEQIWQYIQDLVQHVVEILANIIEAIDSFLNGDMSGVVSAVQGIIQNIWSILQTLVGLVGQLFVLIINAIASYIGSVVATAVSFCQSVLNAITSFAGQMWNAGVEWISNLVNGILDKVTDVYNAIKNLVTQAKSKFTETNWASVGSDIISGIVNGISSAASNLFNTLKNLASNALEAAKSALDIGSPSKAFANQVGRWIPAGISLGVRDAMPKLENEMDEYMKQVIRPVDANFNFGSLIQSINGIGQNGLLDAIYEAIRQAVEDADIRVFMGDREVTRSMKDMGFVYD